MHQEKAQEELGIGLDGTHGGAAELLPTASHLRPGRGAKGGAGASSSSCGGHAREKVARRRTEGEVHGVERSGELGHNSGERFPG